MPIKETHIEFSEERLIKSCIVTSEFLNKKFNTNGVELKLAQADNVAMIDARQQQWERPAFNWSKNISPLNVKEATFLLALFKGNALCGLCKNSLTPVFSEKSLHIDDVEAHPNKAKNPLKGFVIAAFSQANLDIAKMFNIPSIGVRLPMPVTINSYWNVGVQLHDNSNEILIKTVGPDSSLNWERFFAHRSNRGLSCSVLSR